jgi:hypothetical protein
LILSSLFILFDAVFVFAADPANSQLATDGAVTPLSVQTA